MSEAYKTSAVLRRFVVTSQDMVHADGKLDSEEKLYTYTIITTASNKQLEFLHDRYVHGSGPGPRD